MHEGRPVGDIWTWEGWANLASVIDLASRRVVGWQIADHMEASLVCDALEMALGARRPGDGLILHSDRGSLDTSTALRGLLGDNDGLGEPLAERPVPGQCRWRELARHAEGGARPSPVLGDESPGPPSGVRVHRGLLQPPAAS